RRWAGATLPPGYWGFCDAISPWMIFILGPSKDGEKRKTRPRPVGYPARAGTLLPAPQAHPSAALRALAPARAPQAPPRGQARPIAHGPTAWARGPVAVRPRARRAPVALRPRARARAPLHRAPPAPPTPRCPTLSWSPWDDLLVPAWAIGPATI